MSPDNTQYLYDTYPRLYRGHRKSPRKTLMYWGFCCGNGWFQILDDVSRDIAAHALGKGLDPEVLQVKEKFGTLSFYIRGADSDIHGLILQADERSTQTCEMCGAPGKLLDDHGWWKTRCPECIEKVRHERMRDDGDSG